MNETNLLYLVYGMCIMFHLMMGWIFICRKQGLAKKLIGLLMLLVAVQYSKDLVFLNRFYSGSLVILRMASSADMLTVPLYVLILVEFCRPGWLTLRRALSFELPFVAFTLLYMLTHIPAIFYLMVGVAGAYGAGCVLWTLRELPRYHRRLKEEYSYDEDINLHWLRGVMSLFFVILMIWGVSNVYPSPLTDMLYMLSSLVGWSVVCYFINRQETLLRSLCSDPPQPQAVAQVADCSVQPSEKKPEASVVVQEQQPAFDETSIRNMRSRLDECFENQQVFLNPKLRLSELAALLGTNRTYLSQFFNQCCDLSFYEYVNAYRVSHSMKLLRDTDYTLEIVASMSGFNSLSTFRRAFVQCNECSPQQYRNEYH